MEEEWKTIPDYPAYQVSNFGRVKSFYKDKVKIIKPMIAYNGYLRIGLRKGGIKKFFLVHRLVALVFIPNPEGKPQVNHKDGCKLNNFVENLEWATPSENRQHAFDVGLQSSGENSYQAKLTVEQVRYIRENPDKLNLAQLADLFGVSFVNISRIQLGKIWKRAGGSIRKAKPQPPRLPDEVRNQIRAEYVYGSAEFGSYGLARKYGIGRQTILNIVHEQR